VKGSAGADKRLLTTRWQSDSLEAAIDPDHDGNMFSSYYRSRLDIRTAAGGRFTCEDMRTGCAGMGASDGWAGDYSYLDVATSPDG
jgi:hypothetical protein